jgi:hypothetical protein
VDAPLDSPAAANVTGNARITGALGAAIFVLLFFEGLTILRVQQYMVWHVFIGTMLIAFVIAKTASTMYRFFRYYTGQRDYVDKGAPPIILRALGPVITVTTVAVLATGIGALLADSRWLNLAHKAAFVVWFGAATLHVLGHALETPALAFADWRRSRRRQAPGGVARLALLAAALVGGLSVGVLSTRWVHHWHHLHP